MKKPKAGRVQSRAKKSPASGSRRGKITWKQRILLVFFGLIFFFLIEIILRLVPVGVESPAESDPFVGFSELHPLFVSYRAKDGSLRMKTAPGKLRWFNSQDFAAEKEPGTFRIFTLGGSTTYGRPYQDATSFSGWLRELLNHIPNSSLRYEVINAGGISYASYRVVKILEELLQYDPDLFIIYTGHNEFLETRTYENFLTQPPLVFKTRVGMAMRATAQDKIRGLLFEHLQVDYEITRVELKKATDRGEQDREIHTEERISLTLKDP